MSLWTQKWSTTWRKGLVSLPRLVPDSVLYYTSPEGPHPFVINLPSRGTHLIPVYIFIPTLQSSEKPATSSSASASSSTTTFPVLIDFHGGGFILGSCQEQAPFCAKMARELNCIVISVDYRLGPYAQYPAANEDAEDIVNAVIDPRNPAYRELRHAIQKHVDKHSNHQHHHQQVVKLDETRLAFSGFSSGGNLALNLALSVKNDPTINTDWPSVLPASHPHAVPILLFYPSLDCRMLPDERPRPAGLEPPAGFFARLKLETELMPTYLPVAKRGHPRASPGLAQLGGSGGLHEKAKMMLVLPQLDSLSEQSAVWVEKVKDEGRAGDLVVDKVEGVLHGWTQFPDSWLTEEQRKLKVQVFDRARDFVKEYWNRG